MTQKPVLHTLMIAVVAFAVQASAQDSADQGQRRHHRMPPELREQLSADQIQQLEAAQTREEKKALLDSWGIQMPKPPHRRDGHHGPPPREDADQTQSSTGGQQ